MNVGRKSSRRGPPLCLTIARARTHTGAGHFCDPFTHPVRSSAGSFHLSGFYPYLSDLMGVETGNLWATRAAWRQPARLAFRAFSTVEVPVMSTHDNAPPLDGWTVPKGVHCGDYCWGIDCPVCGHPADPFPIPANCELGEN